MWKKNKCEIRFLYRRLELSGILCSIWPESGLSCHFQENMQGVKLSLFKFKMQIAFLSMDNLLKKKKRKRKTSSVSQTDSRVHTKNCF